MSSAGSTGAPRPPKQLGKYIIEDVLGRGGMGTVYKARDPRMGRLVAIKTLTGNLRDPNTLKRFYREAEKTGRLKHANIITIYDLGEEGGHPYIVMEFVEGRALDSILRDPAEFPLLHKLRILEQVCLALGYAHKNDLIHRDVKPGNVMLRPDGLVKLLDFGIAVEERTTDVTLTQTGLVIGTVPYMAPERLLGGEVDGRSDIFATGVLLFQLLTRELPFQGDEVALVNKLINEQHPSLSRYLPLYPVPLDDVLARSLAKRPTDRYESAEEMASDIAVVIEDTKRQYIEDLLTRAQDCMKAQDPPARDLFLEVLKLDPQQTLARRSLAELNQHISRKQQVEHAERKRLQAQDAMLERKFDSAIALLQEALRLVPGDPETEKQLELVRHKQQVAEQVSSAPRQAEEAKRSGEISKALAIVEQALSLDTTNARIRITYNSLVKQVKEAEQRAGARRLLQSAREQLTNKNYDAAFSLIHEAELLDPANAEIQGLSKAAKQEVRLDLRRTCVATIENHIAAAVNEEGWHATSGAVEAALTELPSDPLLLRYKLQVDQQLQQLAEAKQMAGMVLHSWSLFETSPSEALAYVEASLRALPGSEPLQALAAEFRDHIGRQTAEEKRNDYVLRARQALDGQDFPAAVQILESCQGECFSDDVAELLECARTAHRQQRHRRTAADCRTRARKLLQEGKALEAIKAIEAVLHDGYDEPLARLLDEARGHVDAAEQQREAAWARVHQLAGKGLHQQALMALEALAPEWHVPEQEVMKTRFAAAHQAGVDELQRLGRAYSTLLSTDPKRDWVASATRQARREGFHGQAALWAALANRRSEVSASILRGSVQRIRNAHGIVSPALGEELDTSAAFSAFAVDTSARQAWAKALWSCVRSVCREGLSRFAPQKRPYSRL